ncbi:MAG: PmoA family protein [Planctomycetota bacterium]|nr:PmoA family protein [Planctomycetota bacterium]
MSSSAMRCTQSVLVLFAGCACATQASAADPVVGFQQEPGRIAIKVGDRVLAKYVYDDAKVPRPYFTDVREQHGIQVTRNHPPQAGDDRDHPHHTGIFFTFGDLNGVDFWHLKGSCIHERFINKPTGGAGVGTFTVANKYLSPDGKQVFLTETARYVIRATAHGEVIEFDHTLTAADVSARFGSKEEGGLAVRMATPIAISSGMGGRMIDSEGRSGGKAIWGKQAAWVDYSGTIDGKSVGMTVIPHPLNFTQCWYHARDYGLLAANPFGPLNNAKAGTVLKRGESLRLRYGVLVHGHEKPDGHDPKLAAKSYPSSDWAYPAKLPGARVETYKTVGDDKLDMFIFEPEDHQPTDKRAAVVFLFGGGWRSGTPGQFYHQCRYLASRGMVAMTADYRVERRQNATPQDCVEDAKSAIRWVRTHAERLGVDPARIAAGGGSAGGHTACCTGVIKGFEAANEDASISSVPNAMALFNPAVMLAPMGEFNPLGEEKAADIKARTGGKPVEISPIHHVRKGLPPTIIFHGTDDEAVPFPSVLRYSELATAAGNRCELAAYLDQPHGFFNTGRGGDARRLTNDMRMYLATARRMDDFFVSIGWLDGASTVVGPNESAVALGPSRNVVIRGEYQNARIRFANQHHGHVAFLGGSITEMNGYRPMVCEFLQRQFPKTKFTFTDAGISSTCSNTGAFRLEEHVLKQGPVDLLFVEYAVNDDQDAGHSRKNAIRGMEGIVRRLRQHNPHADIVMTHFVNPGMLKLIEDGKTPLTVEAHETVAERYGVSTIYLSREVAQRIQAGLLTWKQFGGTHPAPLGNRICADLIAQLFGTVWNEPLPSDAKPIAYKLPEFVDAGSYANGRFVSIQRVGLGDGWKIGLPEWKSIPGQTRSRFVGIPMLHANKPGSELTLEFAGTAIGAYIVAGPDAGILEVSVDGGEFKPRTLYHRFSRGLHYPRTVMFADDLKPGSHKLTIRISAKSVAGSKGHAARIMSFVSN